jgi:hypothetical protein
MPSRSDKELLDNALKAATAGAGTALTDSQLKELREALEFDKRMREAMRPVDQVSHKRMGRKAVHFRTVAQAQVDRDQFLTAQAQNGLDSDPEKWEAFTAALTIPEPDKTGRVPWQIPNYYWQMYECFLKLECADELEEWLRGMGAL